LRENTDQEGHQDEGFLEGFFALDTRVNLYVTSPMKRAIQHIATTRHISLAVIVRRCLTYALPKLYPEYERLYNRFRHEEIQEKTGGLKRE
jgi:hypothetical protein